MKTNKRLNWAIIGLLYHELNLEELPNFDAVESIYRLRRLAQKDQRIAVMDCNGEGWIRGIHYTNAVPAGDTNKVLGIHSRSAYLNKGDEESIFTIEGGKIADKIRSEIKILSKLTNRSWEAEFQGDPRGATVRLHCYTGGGKASFRDLTDLLYI